MKLYAVFSPVGHWANVQHVQPGFRMIASEYLLECHHIFHDRITENERHTLEHTSYSFHLFRVKNEAYTIVTDTEYPTRTAFLLIRHLRQGDSLDDLVQSFPNPYHADCIAKIQHELDEIMVIIHKNTDILLEKGEKLVDLVENSERLSASAKAVYKSKRYYELL